MSFRKTTTCISTVCLMSLAGGGVAIGDDINWTGAGNEPFFSDPQNWQFFQVPATGDRAINPLVDQIIEDMGTRFAPYQVDSFIARSNGAGGKMTMLGFVGPEDSGINFDNGMWVEAPAGLNDYLIEVGTNDGLFAGDPFGFPHNASVRDFRWDVTGNSSNTGTVAVMGTIGPGEWSVHHLGNVFAGFRPYPAVEVDGVDGIIDSGVTTMGEMGDSEWTIDGGTVRAKIIRNLDHWEITRLNGKRNVIQAVDFMEVRTMNFAGQNGDVTDQLTAGDPAAPPTTTLGLRVLDKLELFSNDPAGVIGPLVEVSELLVSRAESSAPQAVLSIREGTGVYVATTHSARTTDPEFRLASTLLYGVHSGQRPQNFPPQDGFWRTLLDVANNNNLPGVMTFKDESYITAIGDNRGADPAPGELRITHGPNVQDLHIHLHATSLVIESPVAKLPARDWYTGDVDLFVTKESDVTLEAIAPDSCNLWFNNLPEPRCVKYWRNIIVGLDVRLTAVDNCGNYLLDEDPNHDCPCGVDCVTSDDALYVVGSVLRDGSSGVLDVLANNIQLYFGGTDITGNGIQLAFTDYGDFDVDCDVDINDYTLLPFNSKTYYQHILGPDVQTDWPVSDYDGDCDIDLVDFMAFQVGFGKLITSCPPNQTLECPTTGGVGGLGAPEQGGGEEQNPPPVDPWTYQQARVALEIQPVGGGDPVTRLASNTEYELHYSAAQGEIDGYTLWSISDSDGQGIGAAYAPESGTWSGTSQFQYLDLAELYGEPVDAPGYPAGSYRYDQVSDGFASGGSGGPSGYLANFVTESAGDLNLHLYMWKIDTAEQVLVEMNDQAALRVRGR